MRAYGSAACPMATARAALNHVGTPLIESVIKATNGKFEEMPFIGGASSIGVAIIMNFDRRLKVLAESSSLSDHELLAGVRRLPRRGQPRRI